MAILTLKLLGRCEVGRAPEGSEIAFRTRKAKALLAYLAWPPGLPHSRNKLAALLWGRSAQTQARNSLRNNLAFLRKSLSDKTARIVVNDGDRLYLDPESVDVDAVAFDDLVARGTPDALKQAVALYKGEFLEGFELREEAYSEWVASERVRLREKAVTTLTQILDHYVASGEIDRGIQVALRLLNIDPLQEGAHGSLIRLYLKQERYGAALGQHESYRDLLKRELGIVPGPEIEALYQKIRSTRRQSTESSMQEAIVTDAVALEGDADLSGIRGRPVAILPFRNLTQDPDQELFTDGLTEDIIFALSASRSFPVLAHNSTSVYKGRAIDAQTAGKELGAGYVLEGSVRRSGNQLRVNIELVDVETKLQLWSERYERSMDDLFAVQDDITTAVVATLEPEIDAQEMRRVLVAQPFIKLNSYELAQKGFWHLLKFTLEDYQRSLQQFESSLQADPHYARAYAGMTQGKYIAGLSLWEDAEAAMDDAVKLGNAALNLDERDPRALRYLGGAQVFRRQYDEGLQELRRAIAVFPSYAMAYSGLAFGLNLAGEFEDAIAAEATTERLRPGDRSLHICMMSKGIATYQLEDYELAATVCRRSLDLNDQYWMSSLILAATLGQKDEIDQAKVAKERLGRLLPPLTEESLFKLLPFKERSHLDHIIEGLRRAQVEIS